MTNILIPASQMSGFDAFLHMLTQINFLYQPVLDKRMFDYCSSPQAALLYNDEEEVVLGPVGDLCVCVLG